MTEDVFINVGLNWVTRAHSFIDYVGYEHRRPKVDEKWTEFASRLAEKYPKKYIVWKAQRLIVEGKK